MIINLSHDRSTTDFAQSNVSSSTRDQQFIDPIQVGRVTGIAVFVCGFLAALPSTECIAEINCSALSGFTKSVCTARHILTVLGAFASLGFLANLAAQNAIARRNKIFAEQNIIKT